LEAPEELGAGCSLSGNYVVVDHNVVKNAVAFETYNAAGELIRITMYGLASNDAHSFTKVLYPGASKEDQAAAYIMAVGYDGQRVKIFEEMNYQKSLEGNKYYRIISKGQKQTALSCGVNSSVDQDGKVTWSLARAAASSKAPDQIWDLQGEDGSFYIYSPQSEHYLGGNGSQQTTALDDKSNAQKWNAVCVDEANGYYTFNIEGTGNNLNAYSDVNTGMWSGGASDQNNIWKVVEVTTFTISTPTLGYLNACYPFAMKLPEGVAAYTIEKVGEKTVEGEVYDIAVMDSVETGVVPAYLPVILVARKGDYTAEVVYDDQTEVPSTNLLHGTTLKETGFTKGTLFPSLTSSSVAGARSRMRVATTTTSIKANTAYLVKEEVNDSKEVYLMPEDTYLTGVENILTEQPNTTVLYDLNGVKVNKIQRGQIYVTQDGKKIFMK
jgi:hypothetical protein